MDCTSNVSKLKVNLYFTPNVYRQQNIGNMGLTNTMLSVSNGLYNPMSQSGKLICISRSPLYTPNVTYIDSKILVT